MGRCGFAASELRHANVCSCPRRVPPTAVYAAPRVLETGKPTIALAAVAELEFVSLPDALELVLLLVDDPRSEVVLRWAASYLRTLLEYRPVGCTLRRRSVLRMYHAQGDAYSSGMRSCTVTSNVLRTTG